MKAGSWRADSFSQAVGVLQPDLLASGMKAALLSWSLEYDTDGCSLTLRPFTSLFLD